MSLENAEAMNRKQGPCSVFILSVLQRQEKGGGYNVQLKKVELVRT